MTIARFEETREQLKDLRIQHRELDLQVAELGGNTYGNTLELQRLKRRKLILKDTIVKLESQLIPDLNA